MGVTLSICRLSKKREAMLREDPSLCWELNHEVPGFLDVGKAWDALRLAAQEEDTAELSVVKLLAGEAGKSFGEPGAFGKPRILDAHEVAVTAKAFEEVEPGFVVANFDALRGREVHGNYFQDDFIPDEDPADALRPLDDTFEKIRALLVEAAGRGDALLLMFR